MSTWNKSHVKNDEWCTQNMYLKLSCWHEHEYDIMCTWYSSCEPGTKIMFWLSNHVIWYMIYKKCMSTWNQVFVKIVKSCRHDMYLRLSCQHLHEYDSMCIWYKICDSVKRSQKLYMSCERVHKFYTLHLHDLLPPSSVKISTSLCEVYEDKILTNSETMSSLK